MNEYRKLRIIAENAARDTLRKMNESRANRIIESEVRRCFESLEDLDDAPNPSYISDDDWKDTKDGIKKGFKKFGRRVKSGFRKAKRFMDDELGKADIPENPTYWD